MTLITPFHWKQETIPAALPSTLPLWKRYYNERDDMDKEEVQQFPFMKDPHRRREKHNALAARLHCHIIPPFQENETIYCTQCGIWLGSYPKRIRWVSAQDLCPRKHLFGGLPSAPSNYSDTNIFSDLMREVDEIFEAVPDLGSERQAGDKCADNPDLGSMQQAGDLFSEMDDTFDAVPDLGSERQAGDHCADNPDLGSMQQAGDFSASWMRSSTQYPI